MSFIHKIGQRNRKRGMIIKLYNIMYMYHHNEQIIFSEATKIHLELVDII